MKKVDVLILGQGFAGTALALALMEQGTDIHIIDPAPTVSASRIAAGLINPVLGKRFTIDDDYAHLFAAAQEFYQRYEDRWGESFFHRMPIVRVIANEEEEHHYGKRASDTRYSNFVATELPVLQAPFHAPFGSRLIEGGAWLDASLYLDSARALFTSQQRITTATLHESDITWSDSAVYARNMEANILVDARGWESSLSPWWKYLTFQPAKGELLEIASTELDHTRAIVGGVYCIPRGGGKRTERRHIVGSTYTWDNLNTLPTENGRIELEEKFRALCSAGYSITAHHAAVRPATDDRNPYIGVHPALSRLWLFNGFGSRGSLTSPWYAEQCVRALRLGMPLPAECDIERFRKDYDHSQHDQS